MMEATVMLAAAPTRKDLSDKAAGEEGRSLDTPFRFHPASERRDG